MVSLAEVKEYLNIGTTEKDNFISGLIASVSREFWFLPYHEGEELETDSFIWKNGFFILKMKNVPTRIVSLRGVVGTSEYDITDYTHRSNKLFFRARVDFLKLRVNRGFTVLPVDLRLKIIQIVALEFKKSFQGEGAIFYSGRTVENVAFNFYQNVDDEIQKLKREIFLRYGVGV